MQVAASTDDDFAVRLLLCEHHPNVASETVLNTYLEATPMTRGRLLHHPCFQRFGLARLADSPDPQARALVVLDPEAAPKLIERLSNDPHPIMREWMAADPRLSPSRVLELFDDPAMAGAAAANPHLPVPVMRGVLTDAATLSHEVVEGKPAAYLGRRTRICSSRRFATARRKRARAARAALMNGTTTIGT